MSELLPCPFCGNSPVVANIRPHSHKGSIAEFMPDHPGSSYIECGCGAGLIDATEELVRARWNTRAQSSAATEHLILPERITPEIACILEDCSGPEHQSEISLAALMEGYEPTWEQLREHLLRPGSVAQPSQERKTFTVPPGYEAIRDDEGRATGEMRPKIDTRCRKFGGNCVCQQEAECVNARTIA